MVVNEYEIINSQELIIKLLAKIVFKQDEVLNFVVGKRQGEDKKKWIKSYNLCDGEHTHGEIVEETKVNSGNFSTALKNWENLGILYRISVIKKKKERICPKGIIILEEKEE